MILDIDFPPDDRPEKEALSLIRAGYEVYLLCVTKSQKPLRENYKGIHLTRIRFNTFIRKKLSSAYLVLPFYRWIWRRHIEKFIRENNPDILHVHDLPLSDIAVKLAGKYDLKVVCDQHEYWSNWIGRTAHYNTRIGKVVKKLSNWKQFEKKYLNCADLVITVTESLRQCYIEEVSVPPEKIITVPNTPSREIFLNAKLDGRILERYSNTFMLFYAGIIDPLRGIDVVIKALKELEKSIPSIKFVLAGRVVRASDPAILARRFGAEHLVEFAGWLDLSLLPSYMAASKVCIFTPHLISTEIHNTIATKIYQYIAMKKPIIASNARMLRQFILENDLGFLIDPESGSEFRHAVLELYENYDMLSDRFKRNCNKVIQEKKMFWDQTVRDMLIRYSELAENL
jgi:glycosyltransferase involved in cell wall biosynthesis